MLWKSPPFPLYFFIILIHYISFERALRVRRMTLKSMKSDLNQQSHDYLFFHLNRDKKFFHFIILFKMNKLTAQFQVLFRMIYNKLYIK